MGVRHTKLHLSNALILIIAIGCVSQNIQPEANHSNESMELLAELQISSLNATLAYEQSKASKQSEKPDESSQLEQNLNKNLQSKHSSSNSTLEAFKSQFHTPATSPIPGYLSDNMITSSTDTMNTTVHQSSEQELETLVYDANATFGAIEAHPDGTRLYTVRVFMDDVLVIREGDLSQITTIPVGNGPDSIVITPDGRYGLVPINEEDNSRLDIILLTPSHVDYHKVIREVTIEGQRGVKGVVVSPDGTTAYLITQRPGAGAIYPVNLINFTVGNPLPNPWASGENAVPSSMAFSYDGSKFYVSMSQQFNGNDVLVYSHKNNLMTPMTTININQDANIGGTNFVSITQNNQTSKIWIAYNGRKLRKGMMGYGAGFLVLDGDTHQLIKDIPDTESKNSTEVPFCNTTDKESVLVLRGDYYIHTYKDSSITNISTYDGTDYFRNQKESDTSDSFWKNSFYSCSIGAHGRHAYITTRMGSIIKIPIHEFFTGTTKPSFGQTTVYDTPSLQAYYISASQPATMCCDIRVIGYGFQNTDNPEELLIMEHIKGYESHLESTIKTAKYSSGLIREDGFFTSVFPMDYFSFQPGHVATNYYKMKIGNQVVHFELEIKEPFPGASTIYPHHPNIPIYGYYNWLDSYGWPTYP